MNWKNVIGILITTAMVIGMAMAFVGCNAEKAATQKVERLTEKFPSTLDVIRQKNPCDENNEDSTDFYNNKKLADSLIDEIATRDKIIDVTSEVFQSIRKEIKDSLTRARQGPGYQVSANCDSIVNDISDYAAHKKIENDKLRNTVAQLQKVIKEFKPVKVTDPIQINLLQRELTKENARNKDLQLENDSLKKDRDKWKARSKTRFWMIFGLLALLAAIIGYNVKKYISKKSLN
jgi:hypothetical protein